MKYAVISDIHSNPDALRATLDDAKKQGCRRIVCLGDVTGYGYDPHACLDLVRKNAGFCLMGNHDSACVGLEPESEVRLNQNYGEDVRARDMLTAGEKAWLSGLPYILVENGAAFAHGFFIRPEQWGYILSESDAEMNFRAREERIMFCGHTHHACVWTRDTRGRVTRKTLQDMFSETKFEPDGFTIELKRNCRYLVNVGSVGYPRRDLVSCYVIWDTVASTITMRRMPFNLVEYAQKLMDKGVNVPLWLNDILMYMFNALKL